MNNNPEQPEIRLAVVGYRKFHNYEYAKKVIDKWQLSNGKITEIVSGGCEGADTLAERYAKEHNIHPEIYPPDWDKYKTPFGKKNPAGVIRNTQIVNRCTHLLAFVSINSVGTNDTIKKAQKKGVPVKIKNIDKHMVINKKN